MRKRCFFQVVVNGILVAGLLMASSSVFADDTAQLRQKIQDLENRINELQSQVANTAYAQWEDPITQMMLMREQNIPFYLPGGSNFIADTGMFNPKMDIKQTDKQYLIVMDIPGMDKDKINVEVKEGMLIISGERQSETKDNKDNQYYRQERSFGSFMQSIPLPEDATAGNIEAKYVNGVLTVKIPRNKANAPSEDVKKIRIS